MNKHIKRVLCLAVCLTAVFATSCDLLLESLLSSMPSSTSSHGNPLKDESSSSFGQGNGSEEEESSSGIEVELPPAAEPDPEKELIGKETDALGHEIARYSDGSWEDLGRVEPIDFTPKAPATKLGYQSLAKETGETFVAPSISRFTKGRTDSSIPPRRWKRTGTGTTP